MALRAIALLLLITTISGCDKFTQLRAEQPWKWSASGIAETRRRGDLISSAIEAYRARIGKYPAKLTDLQPEFLREIPQPTLGYKEWNYYLIYEGANYSLGVLASEFGRQLFRTSEGWQTLDEHGLRNI